MLFYLQDETICSNNTGGNTRCHVLEFERGPSDLWCWCITGNLWKCMECTFSFFHLKSIDTFIYPSVSFLFILYVFLLYVSRSLTVNFTVLEIQRLHFWHHTLLRIYWKAWFQVPPHNIQCVGQWYVVVERIVFESIISGILLLAVKLLAKLVFIRYPFPSPIFILV